MSHYYKSSITRSKSKIDKNNQKDILKKEVENIWDDEIWDQVLDLSLYICEDSEKAIARSLASIKHINSSHIMKRLILGIPWIKFGYEFNSWDA